MEPNISIQIVWPFAAQEAIIANFEFIEVHHLYLAILKFAELTDNNITKIVSESDTEQKIVIERNNIRSILQKHSIQAPETTKKIRYAIRKIMGKGNYPYDNRRILHRSKTSRQIFSDAVTLALSVNAAQWGVEHLFEIAQKSLPPEIYSVFNNFGISNDGFSPINKTFSDKLLLFT